MQNKLLGEINDCIKAIEQLKTPVAIKFLMDVAELLSNCFLANKKVIIAGNGGSLCDAMHFAEELTGVFRKPRKALPAIALSEPGHITCVGNDLGFDAIFSRGLEAFGQSEDVFIGLTTSGKSPNIIQAFRMAKFLGMHTVAFLGKGGGNLKGVADIEWSVDGFMHSDRIQEAHMAAMHLIIELIEEKLFFSSDLPTTLSMKVQHVEKNGALL